MRIQPWMTAITGALVLLATQVPTSAQMPAQEGGFMNPYGPSADAGAGPGGYFPPPNMPGGSADPSILFPGGTPNTFQPWPAISPYYSPNVGQEQTVNKNGLWFQELFYRRRQYFASVEALAVYFRDPGSATVGSPYATTTPWSIGNVLGVPQDPEDGPFLDVPNFQPGIPGFYAIDPRVLPFPALSDTAGTYVSTASAYQYPIRNGGDLGRMSTAPGIQARLGLMNEDYTGAMITGWWAFESNADFTRGRDSINGIPVTQALSLVLGGVNISPRFGNIPLNNGENVAGVDFGPGSTAKYDVLYDMHYSTQAGGTNLSLYQQPIYRNNGVMVRPLWGARYLYLSEGFAFRGIDSGFTYDVDPVTGRPPINQNQTTPGAGLTVLYDQYEATLSNNIQSNLAGPECGLRFDLGDPYKGFKVWGETIFGLSANNERIHLSGNNIGDPLVDARINGNIPPRMLAPGTDASFDERKNSTHVSPVFQQSVFADFAVLDALPGFKDCELFEGATFRVGYTLLLVGAVARPMESINWQGFPLFPEIQSNRQTWWANQFSASFDWRF